MTKIDGSPFENEADIEEWIKKWKDFVKRCFCKFVCLHALETFTKMISP